MAIVAMDARAAAAAAAAVMATMIVVTETRAAFFSVDLSGDLM